MFLLQSFSLVFELRPIGSMLAKQRSGLLGVNFRDLDKMFDLKLLAFRNPACFVRFSLHVDTHC